MSDDSRDLLAGLLIGGLIGAALGILYAPKSGKETREDITCKANELLDKAKVEYKKAAEKATEVFQDNKYRLQKVIDAGVGAYRDK